MSFQVGSASPLPRDCSGPRPVDLCIWLPICVLYCALYNKLLNVSKCFPELCEWF